MGLLNREVLKLVCVDKVHLFVMFGVKFMKEFTLLKLSFFNNVLIMRLLIMWRRQDLVLYLKVPLLLMTATLNQELLKILQDMIEIRVC